MGLKDQERTYSWPKPGALIRQEVKKLIENDKPITVHSGRIMPYAMYREMVPASYMISLNRTPRDGTGILIDFKDPKTGRVNPWTKVYHWFHEHQGHETNGSFSKTNEGDKDLWVLNLHIGSGHGESINLSFDRKPEQREGDFVTINAAQFRVREVEI